MEAAFLSESPGNRQNVVEVGFVEKCRASLRLPPPPLSAVRPDS